MRACLHRKRIDGPIALKRVAEPCSVVSRRWHKASGCAPSTVTVCLCPSPHAIACPVIDRMQTFSHDAGTDEEVFVFGYEFNNNFYPLVSDGPQDIVGATGEEDLVKESAVSATGVVGKKAPSPKLFFIGIQIMLEPPCHAS